MMCPARRRRRQAKLPGAVRVPVAAEEEVLLEALAYGGEGG